LSPKGKKTVKIMTLDELDWGKAAGEESNVQRFFPRGIEKELLARRQQLGDRSKGELSSPRVPLPTGKKERGTENIKKKEPCAQ